MFLEYIHSACGKYKACVIEVPTSKSLDEFLKSIPDGMTYALFPTREQAEDQKSWDNADLIMSGEYMYG